MTPILGTLIYVGGCTGEITSISNQEIVVSGEYFYYGEGEESVSSEPWSFTYKRNDLELLTKVFYKSTDEVVYNASDLTHS